ncbi:uncharacterized protein LOC121979916 [Zingiber officinale]|uniref:uncharacterized protein LOC121979916 n=1 Tax=Zingiber officinale TaxID=94328 RepID=UPI001C4C64E5|nr:uncharacterized protein LOC121979916 [Zingiber officinale]
MEYSSSRAAFSHVLLSGKLLSSKLLSGLQIRGVGGLLHREPHKLNLQERDQIRGHPLQHQHRGIQHRLAQRGVWAMIAVFLAYSLLQAPSTVFIRPHPAIWRLVHGMAIVYLVALTFLLFQVIVAIGSNRIKFEPRVIILIVCDAGYFISFNFS